MGVSDGSVRVAENRASHAWILHAANGSAISGKGPVDGAAENRTSHRAELQGQTAMFLVLSMIVQYFQLAGVRIKTFCDNQSVVSKVQKSWNLWRFRHTKGADGDLQAVLGDTLYNLSTITKLRYSSEWVKAHQDDTVKDLRSLSRESALNVQMDAATKAAYELPAQWQTCEFVPVYHAEGCAVYLGNKKLTSHPHRSVLEHWYEAEAKQYLQTRHGFPTEVFSSIYWRSMRYALKKFTAHRRATAVKAIHRHLPTQAKLFQQGRVVMSSVCPRCVQSDETNSHIYCCPNADALKQRKADWGLLWKELHRARTATIISQTWRHYLHSLLGLPLGTDFVDTIPKVYGETEHLLQQAVTEQNKIGWEKLLVGMASTTWHTLQSFIDSNNPKAPKRSASDWMNTVTHQFLKFSLRCWKQRNLSVHGATRQEQKLIALRRVREQIKAIYEHPPPLAPQYSSIFAIPLAHRLKMPLQAAEHWVSMITHQAKVTSHNLRILLAQHKPMEAHFRTMRREARQQAKDRRLPSTPRKAHSRAVQAAVKEMRAKLYAPRNRQTRCSRRRVYHSRQHVSVLRTPSASIGGDHQTIRPTPRHHPP